MPIYNLVLDSDINLESENLVGQIYLSSIILSCKERKEEEMKLLDMDYIESLDKDKQAEKLFEGINFLEKKIYFLNDLTVGKYFKDKVFRQSLYFSTHKEENNYFLYRYELTLSGISIKIQDYSYRDLFDFIEISKEEFDDFKQRFLEAIKTFI